jgi:hypothetical protein
MELARLALAVVFATADFLDHHGPTARFLDDLNRFAFAGVDVLGSDVLTILEEVADPVLEGA